MDITILGIESSCDDTSAAVIRNTTLLSNVIASQAVHVKSEASFPKLASRSPAEHYPRCRHRPQGGGITIDKLDAIAFTRGSDSWVRCLCASFQKGLRWQATPWWR